MLRLAPAVMLLLAGCADLLPESGESSAQAAPDRVALIALVGWGEDDDPITYELEVLQADGSAAPRQVYQSVRSYMTPPESMDPSCGESASDVRLTVYLTRTGDRYAQKTIPYACTAEWFIAFADDGEVAFAPLSAFDIQMPADWSRGDPWPWNGDPADEEPESSQPAISWSVSQADSAATVTSADPGTNWSEYQMRFDRAGQLDQTGDAKLTMPAGAYVRLEAGKVGGGDTLGFCVTGAAGPLKATLRHIETNTINREFVFNSADPC